MKTLLLLLIAFPAFGQQVRVVTPNGDTLPYIPQRSITRYIHDTVFFYHDSVGTVREKEIYERETPEPISVYVTSKDTIVEARSGMGANTFGIYGYTDFRGSVLAPSANVTFGAFRVWLYAGAYYTSIGHLATWTAGVAGYAPVISW